MKLNKLKTETTVRNESIRPVAPKEGDLLVWHFYEDRSGQYFHLYQVPNPDEAMKVIDYLTKQQVDDEEINMNCFGLEVYSPSHQWENGWEEWSNDDGDDIMALIGMRDEGVSPDE